MPWNDRYSWGLAYSRDHLALAAALNSRLSLDELFLMAVAPPATLATLEEIDDAHPKTHRRGLSRSPSPEVPR